MLDISVYTPDCAEGEVYHYSVPLGTPWSDIETMCRLTHPDMTAIYMEVTPAEVD